MADNNKDGEKDDTTPDFKYEEKKAVRLSLHLIVKRHLPKEAENWSHEKIIHELNDIRRVRLDRENVGQIDSMELLSSDVTHLYLQSNQIRNIENLECLPKLQVLVLCRNKLTCVEGISHLNKLILLDLSDNDIDDPDPNLFPQSIIILNLKGNPCASKDYHREKFKSGLSKLNQLDGVDLIDEEIDEDQVSDNDNNDDDNDDDEGRSEDNTVNYGDGDDYNNVNERREEEENAESTGPLPLLRSSRTTPSLRANYQQLPDIQCSIPDIATEMLLRSQHRLEDSTNQHKRHVQEMTNLKIKSKIRPMPTISRNS